MARSDRTDPVSRGLANKYLAKAGDFYETARLAAADGRWNSAGLNAIHAGISAADAAVVASAGLRSASKDHGAVLLLLEKSVPEASTKQDRQLRGRLVKWAEGVVSAHLEGPR